MWKNCFEWLCRHRVLAISSANASILITAGMLVGATLFVPDTPQARALSNEEARNDLVEPERRASPRVPRRGPRRMRRPTRLDSSSLKIGDVRPGAAREPSSPRASSFRVINSTPKRTSVRVNKEALPLGRGIETADDYGPWHAQQAGENVLEPLPPGHPLRRRRGNG